MFKQQLNYSKRILLICILLLAAFSNAYSNHDVVDTTSKEYQDYVKYLLARNLSFNKAKLILKSGNSLDKLSRLYPAPPIAEIKSFLDQEQNPKYASQLLDLTLRSKISFSFKDAGKHDILIKMLIKEYHAAPQEISSFDILPSLELSDFLLTNGLNPDKFLDLVLFAETNTQDVIFAKKYQQLNQLIMLAAKYKANFAYFPKIKSTFALKNKLLSFDQTTLLSNILFFIKKYPKAINAGTAKRMANDQGNCHGFTTLWLYSKWLQFNEPEKPDWISDALIDLVTLRQASNVTTHSRHCESYAFYKTQQSRKTLKKLDCCANSARNDEDEKLLNNQRVSNLQKLIEKIDFFQAPRNYIEGMANGDIDVHKIDNRLTDDGRILREQYKIAAVFESIEPLIAVLKNIVIDNVMIYAIYPAQISHSLGIFKHGKYYYFYDPNNIFGEARFESIEQLAKAMMYAQNVLYHNNTLRVGFILCDFNNGKTNYFPQKTPTHILSEAFKASNTRINSSFLENSAYAAISIKDAESMRFLFEQGLEADQVNKEGRSLLDMAATANAPQIVAMLLKHADVDPNQIIVGEVLPGAKGSKIKGGTCLHTAAKKGFFAVVEALLNDPRIIIDQKDAAGKTALDYAIAANRPKTMKILSNYRNHHNHHGDFWRALLRKIIHLKNRHCESFLRSSLENIYGLPRLIKSIGLAIMGTG